MRHGIRATLLKNWPLKLTALIMAVFIWVVLVPEDKSISDRTMTVPLEVRGIPQGLEIVGRPASTIDITVRGPNRILKDINVQEIKAVLDLDKATVYQQEFPLNNSMVYVPSGLSVTSVRPNKVAVKLEKTREESLRIRPAVRGKAADGYRVAGTEVQPASVLVRGPESRIKSKDVVSTAPIDITDLRQTTVFDVDIILPRPELRLLSIFTNVRVTVRIEPDPAAARPGGTSSRKH